MICKQCNIETNRPMFCSRNCSGKWRRLNVYGDKFTNKWRSSSPRKFLSSSLGKGKERKELTLDYLMSLYENQDGKCAITGFVMTYEAGKGRVPTNISIDRIDSTIGYVEGNIQLACIQANKMKMELTTEQLTHWCEAVVTNLKGRK